MDSSQVGTLRNIPTKCQFNPLSGLGGVVLTRFCDYLSVYVTDPGKI